MKFSKQLEAKESERRERGEEPAEITMGLPLAPGGLRGEMEERRQKRVSE